MEKISASEQALFILNQFVFKCDVCKSSLEALNHTHVLPTENKTIIFIPVCPVCRDDMLTFHEIDSCESTEDESYTWNKIGMKFIVTPEEV